MLPANSASTSASGTPSNHSPTQVAAVTSSIDTRHPSNQRRSACPHSPASASTRGRTTNGNSRAPLSMYTRGCSVTHSPMTATTNTLVSAPKVVDRARPAPCSASGWASISPVLCPRATSQRPQPYCSSEADSSRTAPGIAVSSSSN